MVNNKENVSSEEIGARMNLISDNASTSITDDYVQIRCQKCKNAAILVRGVRLVRMCENCGHRVPNQLAFESNGDGVRNEPITVNDTVAVNCHGPGHAVTVGDNGRRQMHRSSRFKKKSSVWRRMPIGRKIAVASCIAAAILIVPAVVTAIYFVPEAVKKTTPNNARPTTDGMDNDEDMPRAAVMNQETTTTPSFKTDKRYWIPLGLFILVVGFMFAAIGGLLCDFERKQKDDETWIHPVIAERLGKCALNRANEIMKEMELGQTGYERWIEQEAKTARQCKDYVDLEDRLLDSSETCLPGPYACCHCRGGPCTQCECQPDLIPACACQDSGPTRLIEEIVYSAMGRPPAWLKENPRLGRPWPTKKVVVEEPKRHVNKKQGRER